MSLGPLIRESGNPGAIEKALGCLAKKLGPRFRGDERPKGTAIQSELITL
jgi:hypothetical protein